VVLDLGGQVKPVFSPDEPDRVLAILQQRRVQRPLPPLSTRSSPSLTAGRAMQGLYPVRDGGAFRSSLTCA
jgi:hypothetical protein